MLEVMEAKLLFGRKPEQIDVLSHPQSIIHSMVQYCDSSIKAQLGLPDMRLPIEYALTFPERLHTSFERLDFSKLSELTFEQPDLKRFRNLALAYKAMEEGGNMPCVLNAANEVVVASFLKGEIGFLEMSDLIAEVMSHSTSIKKPSYEDYVLCDSETRLLTTHLIKKY